MGRSSRDQGQLFYSFNLEEAVPDDHLVRAIAGVLDLSWVRAELAPHYSHTGRPSIDPVLMIRMLIVGYVFAIRRIRDDDMLHYLASVHDCRACPLKGRCCPKTPQRKVMRSIHEPARSCPCDREDSSFLTVAPRS
jgi:hypothetical protein